MKEVKLPTIRTDGKAQVERVREEKGDDPRKEESEERRCKCAKKRKARKPSVFPMICGFGGSKSRLPEAAGAEAYGQRK